MGRAPRTKETLPDFLKWRRVTRPPLVFRGLTGSQRTPGFWGVTHAHLLGFILKPIALMGLREKKWAAKLFGLDPHYNLLLQPNIKGDYTLTSQLESMPADPAQSFSFSLVTTFVIISEGLKSM